MSGRCRVDSQVLTQDGLLLQLHCWEPLAASRGLVVLVHGLGEHAGRYEGVATALMAHGWRVVAYDQRGHGRSEGERGVIGSHDSLLSDLSRVIDHLYGSARPAQSLMPVRSGGEPPAAGELPVSSSAHEPVAEPGGRALPSVPANVPRKPHDEPLVLLGHSMGGLVAARFVAEGLAASPASWSRPVEALVLSSPALDLGLRPWQKLLAALASRWAPDQALGSGLDPHWISRDAAVVRAYVADPLVHDRITGRLARFMTDAGPMVIGLAPLWRMPTLLMWGGADRCVAPVGSARFAKAAPVRAVRAREWPGLAHEIFNEPEKGEVLSQLAIWLDGQFPPEL